jgi:hypothetical protein
MVLCDAARDDKAFGADVITESDLTLRAGRGRFVVSSGGKNVGASPPWAQLLELRRKVETSTGSMRMTADRATALPSPRRG